MAHTNYRRKNPPYRRGGTWCLHCGHSKYYHREAWRRVRRRVRDWLATGQYDAIPRKHPHHIRYDYW